MKKTFWVWVLCCCLITTTPMGLLNAEAAGPVILGQEILGSNGDVSPYFWGHYTKTIERYYTKTEVIPDTIYYEEYVPEHNGTFSGTLSKVSIREAYNQLCVTYRGELYGHM